MKRVKILDFMISGCVLYSKSSRMVILGLVFLLFFSKLSVGNGQLIEYNKRNILIQKYAENETD